MKKTWTRNDIIEAISDSVGLSLSESSIIIEEIFELILSRLENGEDEFSPILIHGSNKGKTKSKTPIPSLKKPQAL